MAGTGRRRGRQSGRWRRRLRGFVWVVGITLLVTAIVRYFEADVPKDWQGRSPDIRDGDTLVLAGRKVRLLGLDAPEMGQMCGEESAHWPCGRFAKNRLAALTRGQMVRCQGKGRDRYDRILAYCETKAGDIGARLVAEGWAVSRSSRYDRLEAQARRDGRGIWRGPFTDPADWRRQKWSFATLWATFRRLLTNLLSPARD